MWKSLQELDLHWHRIVTGKLCYQRSSSLTPFSGSLSADGSDLLQWPQAIIPRCWIFRWYGDRETCCKSERVLRRVSASPREQSEDRSNNGPPSQIWTPLWERISEAPGKAGGCEEVLDCSLWSIGDNGRAPWRLFLFFFLLLHRSSPTSWVDGLETVLSLPWEQWSRLPVWRATHPQLNHWTQNAARRRCTSQLIRLRINM